MKPEQQTKIFSTEECKVFQVKKRTQNNIPTWQWFQNTKVLKIGILKIEKEKINFVQYLGYNVHVVKFDNALHNIIMLIFLRNKKCFKTMATH